jgi:hypothetical protein
MEIEEVSSGYLYTAEAPNLTTRVPNIRFY